MGVDDGSCARDIRAPNQPTTHDYLTQAGEVREANSLVLSSGTDMILHPVSVGPRPGEMLVFFFYR